MYVLDHRSATEPVLANHWEYLYYFRDLGTAFASLGERTFLPQTRQWLVLTHPTPEDRRQLDRFFARAQWRVLDRREFAETTVLLLDCRQTRFRQSLLSNR